MRLVDFTIEIRILVSESPRHSSYSSQCGFTILPQLCPPITSLSYPRPSNIIFLSCRFLYHPISKPPYRTR